MNRAQILRRVIAVSKGSDICSLGGANSFPYRGTILLLELMIFQPADLN